MNNKVGLTAAPKKKEEKSGSADFRIRLHTLPSPLVVFWFVFLALPSLSLSKTILTSPLLTSIKLENETFILDFEERKGDGRGKFLWLAIEPSAVS